MLLAQGLTPGEIKEWYVWGGGSARITLKRAVESRGGLEEYKTELLDLVTPKSPGNVAVWSHPVPVISLGCASACTVECESA